MHRPAALASAVRRRLVRAAAVVVPTLAALAGASHPARAQYFGRNKVNYQTFKFRTLKTPHFDVLYYPYEQQAAEDGGRLAERWYARLSPFMRHTFQRKSIVFFSDQSDFQQNNITDIESEGTGGVTESFRQRVIMPFTGVYADNNHVLGHELVHVFQYDIANATPGAQQGLNTLPLWLIEGMAEYLSLGRSDVNTAMWLRDAARRNDVPTIKQLTNDPRYFPYRYGQALWAYVGGRYGDQAVVDVYRASLRYGFEGAIRRTLDVSTDQLSKDWKASIQGAYLPLMAGRTNPDSTAHGLVFQRTKRGGEYNIGPAVSPDGRTIAFYSSRGLFSIEIYLADAVTGKVTAQLGSLNSPRHFDALSFVNSAGAWSPDGSRFAYVVYQNGNQVVQVYDVQRRRIDRTLKTPGIGAALDPAWSPDGRTLAFVGQVGGISDLYTYDLASDRVTKLTSDRYANLQPAWSPDGRTIAYVTDQGPGTDFDRMTFAPTRVGLFNLDTRQTRILDGFPGARHINPQFAADGRSIYYVADPDGFSDLYRQDLAEGGQRYRVTRTATGIAGITNLSPAISVARQTGRVVMSVFDRGGYDLVRLEQNEAQGTPVPETRAAPAVASSGSATGGTTNAIVSTGTAVTAANNAIAAAARDTTPAGVAADPTAAGAGGVLPPAQPGRSSTIEGYLAEAGTGLPRADTTFADTKLVPRISLDYVAPPSVGVGYNSYFGGGVSGGVAAFFSDQLGNQNVAAVLQAQGQLADIGGQVQYINTKYRWNYGAGIGHVPIPFGYAYVSQSNSGYDYHQLIGRVTQDFFYGLTQYPLNATQRFEFTAGITRQTVSGRDYLTNLDPSGSYVTGQSNNRVSGLSPAYNFAQLSAGFVGDYSTFGLTSPIAGGRYRFEAAPSFGDLHFVQLTADYRRYLYFRPVTFAVRGLHIGRYGGNSNTGNNLDSLFAGYNAFSPTQPYYLGLPTLIRGYDLLSSNNFLNECPAQITAYSQCPAISRLFGNRLAVASAEFRIPLLAPAGLGLINTNILPVDLVPFIDGGVAWTSGQAPRLKLLTGDAARTETRNIPLVSTGVSTRINVLGFAVAEVFYAHAFQRPDKPNVFGFVLSPGW